MLQNSVDKRRDEGVVTRPSWLAEAGRSRPEHGFPRRLLDRPGAMAGPTALRPRDEAHSVPAGKRVPLPSSCRLRHARETSPKKRGSLHRPIIAGPVEEAWSTSDLQVMCPSKEGASISTSAKSAIVTGQLRAEARLHWLARHCHPATVLSQHPDQTGSATFYLDTGVL